MLVKGAPGVRKYLVEVYHWQVAQCYRHFHVQFDHLTAICINVALISLRGNLSNSLRRLTSPDVGY